MFYIYKKKEVFVTFHKIRIPSGVLNMQIFDLILLSYRHFASVFDLPTTLREALNNSHMIRSYCLSHFTLITIQLHMQQNQRCQLKTATSTRSYARQLDDAGGGNPVRQRRVQNTCEHSERINRRMRHLIICQLFLHRNAVLTGKCSRVLRASQVRNGKLFSSCAPITRNRFITLASFPTLALPPFSHFCSFSLNTTIF